MKERLARLWARHRSSLMAAAAILLLYLLLFALGISCPIKYLSGISCPGCGMTRACIHALRLDFSAAFFYHPLWIALPFVASFLIFFKIKGHKKAFFLLLYIAVGAMLAVYFYRLLLTDTDIVVYSPENGLFARLFRRIANFFKLK